VLFSQLTKFAAALFLLTIGLAAPVHAQNNKQIISEAWYEDRATTSTSTATLTVAFAQTPSDKFLNVTNVSCNVTMNSTQVIDEMFLQAGTTSGAGDLSRFYEIKGNVTPETSSGIKFYSIVANGIFYKFGPGRFPSILIDTMSTGLDNIQAKCVIVGNLSDN
jgi:hypothetical protein